MSLFLEEPEVVKLTGYVMPSFQLKYCAKHGIPARLNARGEVIIARVVIEGRGKAENDPKWQPDFAANRKG